MSVSIQDRSLHRRSICRRDGFQLRDLNQVLDKLKVVLMPLGKESQQNVIRKLRECMRTLVDKIIQCALNLHVFLVFVVNYCRGSVGAFIDMSFVVLHSEHHCPRRRGISRLCRSVRYSMVWCGAGDVERSTTWGNHIFFSEHLYSRLLCLSSYPVR